MAKASMHSKLGIQARQAKFFRQLSDNAVQCYLCPRNCKLGLDAHGFCGVRGNEGGRLVTRNYGASVEMTQEVIETEAVYHYMPGEPILSLGNIGCMMNCSFCHNWRTSQIKHVRSSDVHLYTPEDVVETAVRKGIKVLSWTYNDPVVWHEFVYDTALLAKQHGLINLYKSAFFIGPEAVEELHDVIDIFSLSLKSMDAEFYRKVTKGRLEPVLEAIKQVHSWGDRHLEVSNLCVTGMNDSMTEARKVAEWVLENLGDTVPLHYVRFHPDYRYTHVGRTSIPFLMDARLQAKEMGVKHCYVGNVFEPGEHLNTYCAGCGTLLVERFGISAKTRHLRQDGACSNCGKASGLRPALPAPPQFHTDDFAISGVVTSHAWPQDVNATHAVMINSSDTAQSVHIEEPGEPGSRITLTLKPAEQWRLLIARTSNDSLGVKVLHPAAVDVTLLDVLDRAHFPSADPEIVTIADSRKGYES